MEKERSNVSGFSPILITAALSVVALLGVSAWQTQQSIATKDTTLSFSASAANTPSTDSSADAQGSQDVIPGDQTSADAYGVGSTTDPISAIGPAVIGTLATDYATMQQQGVYTQQSGEAVAQGLGQNIHPEVAYTSFDATSVTTDPDTSAQRALAYRADLQASLKPLLKNTEAEFVVFGRYVQTGDVSNLTELQDYAKNYRDAIAQTAALRVPVDAVSYHLAILNAMAEFAATLDAMASHADDPFASAALLTSYNSAEQDMVSSFNSLTVYFKQKTQ